MTFGAKMARFWKHPWVVAAGNLLVVMAIYSLSRWFFYAINTDMFPNVSRAHLWEMMRGGVRFDLTAVLYLNSVYILLMLLPLTARIRNHAHYQRVAQWFYGLPNAIGVAVNCADMVYVRFTDRRTTCTFFSEFQHDSNLVSIFLQSVVQYWYVSLFALAMIVLIVVCSRRKAYAAEGRKWLYYSGETVLLLVSAYFCVIGIRGGFGRYTRPITISNALQYTDTPQETAILLNTPFSLMKSLENETYINPRYYADNELESVMTPIHRGDSAMVEKPLNVVVLIVESFSKEYIGFYNHDLDGGTYTGYTPFLDSLLAHSVTYRYSYASGRKSIDAMPSVLSSIPMLIEPYIVTPYSTNAVSSLADCLGRKGYTTAFFHGAPNGSMGFQAYARSAGFGAYYGMDEYDGPEAFDGTWAIWDEEFLQYYARTMSTMSEPFMTAVFTASSHHPFRVPARYEGVFPNGQLPIHRCVGYSDHALREFFAYAKTQPWFRHTLFVLTADHTNQLTHPEYTNAKGIFEVPIAFYQAGMQGDERAQAAVSQTDIMPSVLAYLGYDMPYFAFGEDVLTQPKTHPYAVCYNHPIYQILSDSLLVQFDGQQITVVYNYQKDRLLQRNIVGEASETGEVRAMESYLKAYIQQYISRMIDNRLTCAGEVVD